jgi:hypothetical protein
LRNGIQYYTKEAGRVLVDGNEAKAFLQEMVERSRWFSVGEKVVEKVATPGGGKSTTRCTGKGTQPVK